MTRQSSTSQAATSTHAIAEQLFDKLCGDETSVSHPFSLSSRRVSHYPQKEPPVFDIPYNSNPPSTRKLPHSDEANSSLPPSCPLARPKGQLELKTSCPLTPLPRPRVKERKPHERPSRSHPRKTKQEEKSKLTKPSREDSSALDETEGRKTSESRAKMRNILSRMLTELSQYDKPQSTSPPVDQGNTLNQNNQQIFQEKAASSNPHRDVKDPPLQQREQHNSVKMQEHRIVSVTQTQFGEIVIRRRQNPDSTFSKTGPLPQEHLKIKVLNTEKHETTTSFYSHTANASATDDNGNNLEWNNHQSTGHKSKRKSRSSQGKFLERTIKNRKCRSYRRHCHDSDSSSTSSSSESISPCAVAELGSPSKRSPSLSYMMHQMEKLCFHSQKLQRENKRLMKRLLSLGRRSQPLPYSPPSLNLGDSSQSWNNNAISPATSNNDLEVSVSSEPVQASPEHQSLQGGIDVDAMEALRMEILEDLRLLFEATPFVYQGDGRTISPMEWLVQVGPQNSSSILPVESPMNLVASNIPPTTLRRSDGDASTSITGVTSLHTDSTEIVLLDEEDVMLEQAMLSQANIASTSSSARFQDPLPASERSGRNSRLFENLTTPEEMSSQETVVEINDEEISHARSGVRIVNRRRRFGSNNNALSGRGVRTGGLAHSPEPTSPRTQQPGNRAINTLDSDEEASSRINYVALQRERKQREKDAENRRLIEETGKVFLKNRIRVKEAEKQSPFNSSQLAEALFGSQGASPWSSNRHQKAPHPLPETTMRLLQTLPPEEQRAAAASLNCPLPPPAEPVKLDVVASAEEKNKKDKEKKKKKKKSKGKSSSSSSKDSTSSSSSSSSSAARKKRHRKNKKKEKKPRRHSKRRRNPRRSSSPTRSSGSGDCLTDSVSERESRGREHVTMDARTLTKILSNNPPLTSSFQSSSIGRLPSSSYYPSSSISTSWHPPNPLLSLSRPSFTSREREPAPSSVGGGAGLTNYELSYKMQRISSFVDSLARRVTVLEQHLLKPMYSENAMQPSTEVSTFPSHSTTNLLRHPSMGPSSRTIHEQVTSSYLHDTLASLEAKDITESRRAEMTGKPMVGDTANDVSQHTAASDIKTGNDTPDNQSVTENTHCSEEESR